MSVEVARAVDGREMADAVHAGYGAAHNLRVANISFYKFDVLTDVRQPAATAAPVVVEHAYRSTLVHQPSDQCATEKTCATCDEIFRANIEPYPDYAAWL